MSKNYAAGTPVGNNQMPLYNSPAPFKAIGTVADDSTPNTSSILNLSANTTAIEVATSGGPAFIQWLSQSTVDSSVAGTSVISTGAAANYDHMIPPNTVTRFVVPISTGPIGVAPNASAVGVAVELGLFRNVAFKGTAASIVSITQYGSSNSY